MADNTLLVIAVLIVGFLVLSQQGILPQNIQDGLSNLTGGTGGIGGSTTLNVTVNGENETPTPTIVKPDLRNIFAPFIAAFPNISNICVAAGGTWRWEAEYVGCTATIVPTIDCSLPEIIVALNQCTAVGAQSVCTPNNAYCKY